MIPFEFEYYKPKTIADTIKLYHDLDTMGKKPLYYGGGTEFISMARMHNVYSEAIIDIKGIPDLNIYEINNDELIMGAAITLRKIAELNLFPLLSLTVQRIADHTIQDKITLGGNIAGTIIYREAVLPLMVANSDIVIAGKDGTNRFAFKDIFNKKLKLNKGDLICQIIIKRKYLNLPSIHVKRTKVDKIDYPLITMVVLRKDEKTNFAFSGLGEYPFRSSKFEQIFNSNKLDKDKKIKDAINSINTLISDDLHGRSEYKVFMLHTIISEALEELKGVN